MIIISKYKDYYDYLVGIYGRDEKLVLDRRDGFVSEDIPFHPQYIGNLFEFHICGKEYDIYVNSTGIYFGERLEELGKVRDYNGKYVSIPTGYTYPQYVNARIEVVSSDLNDKYNCPILVRKDRRLGGFHEPQKFPRLSDFNFGSILSPEEIYIQLSTWLGREKTIPNNQTNVEKIESHGFDKKTSFRPKIKK